MTVHCTVTNLNRTCSGHRVSVNQIIQRVSTQIIPTNSVVFALWNHCDALLFSYYDFYSIVIGLASLPGMCIHSDFGGIEQVTYDNEYNANIVAHETIIILFASTMETVLLVIPRST